jgi:hypothetical protein
MEMTIYLYREPHGPLTLCDYVYVEKAIMEEAYGDARMSNIARDEDGLLEWALRESMRDTRRSGVSYSPLCGASGNSLPTTHL